jgi:phosphoribosyl-ATP pyrophosphohydrolase
MSDIDGNLKSRKSELIAQRAARRLDLRIAKLLNEGHSKTVTAKRLKVTEERVEVVIESMQRWCGPQ